MSTDRHDWDREERQALAGLEDQIDAMRRRHVGAPPFELLRAAQADALPDDLQTSVSEHLAASAMSRTLAEGLGEDAPALSAEEQERLLARIMKDARKESAPASAWGWLRPVLVGTGIVAVASMVWIVSKGTEVSERLGPPETSGRRGAAARGAAIPAAVREARRAAWHGRTHVARLGALGDRRWQSTAGRYETRSRRVSTERLRDGESRTDCPGRPLSRHD